MNSYQDFELKFVLSSNVMAFFNFKIFKGL